MRSKTTLFLLIAFAWTLAPARTAEGFQRQELLDQARAAYQEAQRQHEELESRPAEERSRADYLRVIQLYRRVYLITPHTGYADDALARIAPLYEAINETDDAIRILEFLVSDYPSSRYVPRARTEVQRLRGEAEALAAETEPGSESPSEVSIKEVRHWDEAGGVRVVIETEGTASFRQGELANPPRVYVDIRNARLGPGFDTTPVEVASGELETIRVAQHDVDTVRIVLDLVEPSGVEAFALSDPDRLVIDIPGPTRVRAHREPVTETESAPEARVDVADSVGDVAERVGEVAEAPPDDLPIPTPAQPNEHGDHSLVRSLGLKIGRVVIDPGHGGRDTGTIGSSGLTEKELTLDIARRLAKQIEVGLGTEVVLTRQDDSFVSLEERTAIANDAGADLFVSIHVNSSRADSIRGFETYFLNVTTARDELEVAARENASSHASISDFEGILEEIMLQDKLEESRELATHVQKALAGRGHFGRDRGVKQAPFMVLIGAKMPSILAEISFISNPDDERLLMEPERRQEFADALFEGVRSYADTLSAFRTAHVQD